MAKTTDLAEVTTLADGDLGNAVDVSNTTMDATGTNSKFTMANLWVYIKSKADLVYQAVGTYVTAVSITTANGVSGSSSGGATPALTISLGNITPSGVQVSGLTASEIVATDASKNLQSLAVATYPSLTELSYVKGVTSSIQTQINAKGTGNVSKVGTPVDNQVGVWTGDGTIEGDTALTFDTATDTLSTGTGGVVVTGTVELGHASDTTLSRVSAGVVAVEGNNILTTATGLPLTGGTMTGNITLGENTSIALDPAGSADGKYTGITVTGTAGYTQAFGDLVYLDPTDSRWEATDANSASGADGDARGMLGMVVSAGTDGTACTILLVGIIRADAKFPTFTVNNPIYVSETAGAVTQTQPTTTDVVIRQIGSALTADEMFFNPDWDWITHT